MAIFKKNDKQTIAELESYYAGQNQTRTGMAWVMAFLSLFVTVAVLSGLFFGGRWIYRSLTNDDNNGTTVEVADLPEVTPFVEETNEAAISDSGTEEGVVSDEAATTDTPSDDESESVTVDNDSTSSSSVSVGVDDEEEETATVQTTPRTGDSAQMLPSTGMSDTIIVVMIALVATGYLAARKYQLR